MKATTLRRSGQITHSSPSCSALSAGGLSLAPQPVSLQPFVYSQRPPLGGAYADMFASANLLGLNFGSGDELQYPDDEDEEDEEDSRLDRDSDEQRRWHRSERDDFRKLGTMFAEFLLMRSFALDPKAFSVLVTDPIFESEGPFPGDTRVLSQVMASVMVRHRYVSGA